MKRYHKLLAVTRHEYLTIVKQPSFWITLLIVPLLLAVIMAVGYFSAQDKADVESKADQYSVAVVDQSGFISEDIANSAGVKVVETTDVSASTEQVRKAELDGLIVYPEDLTDTRSYAVIVNTDDGDPDKQAAVSGLGEFLLQQSLVEPLGSPDAADLIIAGTTQETITYKDGQETAGFLAYVVPGAFLVLFFIAMTMAVGYALTSVSEEKENRAIEMTLSYVKPRTLMSGKLLGITLITLIQFVFYAVTGVAAYLAARALGNDLQLPFSIDDLVFEWQPILFGAAYFITGFLLYVSMMLAIGAAFPSAKESSGFTTIIYFLAFAPFWAFETVRTVSDAFITQFFSYFPLTAPSALLLRNTAGNISLGESLLGLAVLIASTIVSIWLAGKLFKLGALNYSSRVKLSEIFRKS